MKKWLIFGGGILTGIVLTFLVALLITSSKSNNNGITWFDEPGEMVNQNSFKVFQVLEGQFALVHGKSDYSDRLYLGTVYLITNDDNKYYYDDEIVTVPSNMVVRQVGMYRYKTKNDFEKNVPIIEILPE